LRGRNVPDPIPAFERPWLDRPPGSTTDDTALARNLVRSLAARGGLDPADLVERHLAWFRSDPPDVGTLTGRVLRRVDRGEDAATVARDIWQQRGPEVSAGNGSVMYCAPLGLAYAGRPDELHDAAPSLSEITHADGRCRTACLAVTLAVAALVRGDPPEASVRGALAAIEGLEGSEELEHLVGAAGIERPIDGPDRGFVFFTSGVALRAAGEERPFEAGLRDVVALGGDTDTNAAVTGALLGALHGARSLPGTWLERLADRTAIEAEARELAGVGPDPGASLRRR
ncbi:MAG TPA: ADP-ribosylglycohydrolase family protein, partial [Actinomycetota bacterium]|nr:ADP-ribosylglycohydrolase family protein [Actinomycetota bacterium]